MESNLVEKLEEEFFFLTAINFGKIMTFDEKINKELKKDLDLPTPLVDFNLGPIGVFIWKYFDFSVDIIETYPYELDGSYPLIMIQLGWIEFLFENKLIYKYIYKIKHNSYPMGLQ